MISAIIEAIISFLFEGTLASIFEAVLTAMVVLLELTVWLLLWVFFGGKALLTLSQPKKVRWPIIWRPKPKEPTNIGGGDSGRGA